MDYQTAVCRQRSDYTIVLVLLHDVGAPTSRRFGTAAVFKVNSSKVCLGGSRVPHLTSFQQGVQERKQLPNAGDHDDFEGFALGFEPLGKGFDDGIAALRGERRHVTRGACAGSSSSRRSLAVTLPRLLVEGSDSSERADLLTTGLAEFTELGKQRTRSAIADTWHRRHNVYLFTQRWIAVDFVIDLSFNRRDLCT